MLAPRVQQGRARVEMEPVLDTVDDEIRAAVLPAAGWFNQTVRGTPRACES